MLTDEEYIQAGVGLASDWTYRDGYIKTPETKFGARVEDQEIRDCLAAQLARQVDALEDCDVVAQEGYVYVERDEPPKGWTQLAVASSEDRTMNTIKAIVDSEVLT